MQVLSHIDCFLFSVDWEDHFQRVHEVARGDHVAYSSFVLHVGDVASMQRPFRFENVWLEVEDFPNIVKTWWDQFHISSYRSYVLAKK